MLSDAVNTAEKNLRDILALAVMHTEADNALVVFDTRSDLSSVLASAYRRCLPTTKFVDFDAVTHEVIFAEFSLLSPRDLVVLIQSTNFRLEAFRIRIELFKRGLKVIEHPHLGRMPGKQIDYYIDSLAYDPAYFRGTGISLKQRIDRAASGSIDSGEDRLVFAAPFETAKLNIGDYSGIPNVGGQFPIGEVFTESKDLEAVNGRVRIFAFGDTSFSTNKPAQPITLVIGKGRVIDTFHATPEFDKVLANIRADEGEIWLRELGFGLNRAFTRDKTVHDVGTYERMCGVHLSLGAKHGVYSKSHIRRATARHHVDVFVATESVKLNDEVVYRNGAWRVS
jgi:hypothetical protein